MRLVMGEEHLIVSGMTAEENPWGKYQFPIPYRIDDKILVSVHVEDDDLVTSGNPTRWFESKDDGETWNEVSPDIAAQCGLKLPNGDKLYFPVDGGIDLSEYNFPDYAYLTPGYDFSKKAEGKNMPIQDGVTAWWCGPVIRAYKAERLPKELSEKKWKAVRIPAGTTEPQEETVDVDWPYLTRVVLKQNGKYMMKPINPRGRMKVAPDGSVWVSAFSGEGHLNPKNGWYSPYYSAELFKSDDNGHTFYQQAHMEYPADGVEFPYQSGGFSDSDFEFMDDGSIIWFMRSAWMASTGYEWAPMYWSRSFDGGKTWTKPEKFSDIGILPRLCKLECGVTLLCYARPGHFVTMCKNDDPEHWTEPLVVMTPDDRSKLANHKVVTPKFHEWDGACGNPELIEINDHEALIVYGDFYYPDKDGVKRKSILCRKLTVEF